jgi:hypothetical protein
MKDGGKDRHRFKRGIQGLNKAARVYRLRQDKE